MASELVKQAAAEAVRAELDEAKKKAKASGSLKDMDDEAARGRLIGWLIKRRGSKSGMKKPPSWKKKGKKDEDKPKKKYGKPGAKTGKIGGEGWRFKGKSKRGTLK
jgi:hypothetical protein